MTDREHMMAAYDKLPPLARKALQDAIADWVPQPLLTGFRRGRTEQQLAAIIEEWDEREREKYWKAMRLGLFAGHWMKGYR